MLHSLYTTINAAENRILLIQSTLLVAVMMVTYILYCTKDSLMVHHMGPEAVVFARTYLVVPVFFLFFLGYTKALNYFRQSTIFNTVIFFSFSYYLLFSFYLYPNMERLSIQTGIDLITFWPITLYYLVSELWVVFVLGVMTWQAFNAVHSTESARTEYYFLQLVSNLALLLAGQAIYHFGLFITADWQTSLQLQTVLIIIFASIAMLMQSMLLYKEPPEKLKLSLKESFQVMFASKQIRILFIAIFAYGIC